MKLYRLLFTGFIHTDVYRKYNGFKERQMPV